MAFGQGQEHVHVCLWILFVSIEEVAFPSRHTGASAPAHEAVLVGAVLLFTRFTWSREDGL